ncbi:hypothetical protein JTB14_034696 [Gonioctena quinquepunctata]|nr:hypothetical protein JTB14_034696 [Gonioctena quinquepunctata]
MSHEKNRKKKRQFKSKDTAKDKKLKEIGQELEQDMENYTEYKIMEKDVVPYKLIKLEPHSQGVCKYEAEDNCELKYEENFDKNKCNRIDINNSYEAKEVFPEYVKVETELYGSTKDAVGDDVFQIDIKSEVEDNSEKGCNNARSNDHGDSKEHIDFETASQINISEEKYCDIEIGDVTLENYHGTQIDQCELCPKRFSYRRNLKKHLNNHKRIDTRCKEEQCLDESGRLCEEVK